MRLTDITCRLIAMCSFNSIHLKLVDMTAKQIATYIRMEKGGDYYFRYPQALKI